MRRWISLGSSFLGILTIGFGHAAAAGKAGTLPARKINPLTGPFAADATALHRGIRLAVEEANAKGALRVALAACHDEGNPERPRNWSDDCAPWWEQCLGPRSG
jgi:hypothetical protein